jgi:hypothetical protein
MPKKISVKARARGFRDQNDEILKFVGQAKSLSDKHQTWCHDHAIIMLYREFERLIFEALVGAINNDTQGTISSNKGYDFPKHLAKPICEYLVVQDGYFDFKGRDGLIKLLKRFLPDDHYLVQCVRKGKYKDAIEQLYALRNFAAHESPQAKKAVLSALNQKRFPSSGAWLKKQDRLQIIINALNDLSKDLEAAAPY